MRKLIILFLVLLGAILLGLILYQTPGYLLIVYKNWTIESTLWSAIFALLLIILISYVIFKLVSFLIKGPKLLYIWFKERHVRKARRFTRIGLYAFNKGKWRQAEKLLMKGAKYSDMPLLNYITAAKAAYKQGEFARSEVYLQQSEISKSNDFFATGLTRVELLLESCKFDEALAILKTIRRLSPRNSYVLELLKKIYLIQKNWKALKGILPILRNRKVIPTSEIINLEKIVYLNLLEDFFNRNELEKADDFWEKLPHYLQNETALLAVYIDVLIKLKKEEFAEKLLHKALKDSWNELLVDKYGLISADNQIKQLAFAESFLRDYPQNATLLLCLGRLCVKQRLWGKAQSYFEASLGLQKNPKIYIEFGNLMEKLNNISKAMEYYRQALLVK